MVFLSEETTDEQRKKKKHTSEEYITFKIKDEMGEKMDFIARRCQLLVTALNRYAQRKGIDPDSIRFYIDGNYLYPHETFAKNNILDEDVIDVKLVQTGC